MRLALLLLGGLFSQPVFAQLSGYEAGSYVLANNPALPHQGQLKLRNDTQLVVRDETGKTLKLTPEQVTSFRLGLRKFRVASGFHLSGSRSGGLGGVDVAKVFVEQLDSGQVMLLRYAFQVGLAGPGGTAGSAAAGVYLLQWPDEDTVTAAQGGAYTNSTRQFRDDMRPFFILRPDLSQCLEDKRLTADNLPAAVHALNHNLPFTP